MHNEDHGTLALLLSPRGLCWTEMRWRILSLVKTWERWFFSQWLRQLEKKLSTPNRCWTYTENWKDLFQPQVPIQPCRLKSDSAPPGAIWTQFKPKLSNQKAILTRLGAISALDWPWFKGAKLDSKIRLHFNHRKAPFLGLKQIFPINSVWSSGYYIAQMPHHLAYLICLDGTGGLRLYDNLIMRKPQTSPVCLLTLPLSVDIIIL